MPKLFANLRPQMLPYDPNDCGDELGQFPNALWHARSRLCNGPYTFVALPNHNPFGGLLQDLVGNSIYVRVSKTHHHDNLAVGRPVHYAGMVYFNAGLLRKWSNHSGHYQPDAIFREQAPKNFNPALFQTVLNDGTLAPILNDGTLA